MRKASKKRPRDSNVNYKFPKPPWFQNPDQSISREQTPSFIDSHTMDIVNNINSRLISYLFLLFFFGSRLHFCLAADTIVPGQSISGSQTLVSAGEKFVLGFFSPGNSQNHYLGIWFKKDEPLTIVWVANREHPITDSSAGVLKFSNDGNLAVFDGNQNGRSLWSTASSVSARSAKLLDSGNLVLIDEDDNSGRILWQSFDYPTDTFIPGMKIGRNLRTGLNWSLTSWKSSNDPSPGNLTLEMDFMGLPQLLILKGHSRYWSSGPWNGQRWLGALPMGRGYFASYSFTIEDEEEYYTIPINISTAIVRMILDNSGVHQIFTWSEDNRGWILLSSTPRGPCELYAACGPFGVCSVASFPTCSCLTGFEPKSQQDWDLNYWTGGCVRKTALRCGDEDGFLRLIRMKLPDTMTLDEVDESLSIQDCKAKCLNKCSCTGYANFGIRGAGSGCAIWSGPLLNFQEFASGGVEFYLRVASSELGPGATNETITSESSSKRRTIAITVAALLSGLLFVVVWCGCCMRKKKKKNINGEKDREEEDGKQPFFNLDVIEAATDNFSLENKLGEGGFGPVYKGKLPNGQEIAVKRLSRSSGQGILEFENEVMLAAKLQHKNLVKLVGYCTEGEEKILIYEYMPNKGLDTFLFDQNKSPLLDWKMRFNIIVGVARGILYLHEDSRLRVIHRDLKASNILLDAEMSPKISDFGMARSFERNQIQANTKKVVGTYGYISPEYAARGLFSEKSDIFSFGILVLEIVSGKKTNVFYHSEESLGLTGYGWLMWHKGRPLEFMDPSLGDSCPTSEVLRCIHIGLLCVQESPRDRPNMLSILSMLDSETELPPPKKPAFSSVTGIDTTSTRLKSCSTNNVTITMTHAR